MRSVEKEDETSYGAPCEHIELTLPSVLESVAEIEEAIEPLALRAGWDEDTASNIAMAIREAAINAVKHGNSFSPTKNVTASLKRDDSMLTLKITDEGDGLDPTSIPDPLALDNLLRSSGRGVFLMRAIMDEVHFRQLTPGTEVTLIKHKQKHMEASS